eukprot:3713660-Rhodomonas_salina.1
MEVAVLVMGMGREGPVFKSDFPDLSSVLTSSKIATGQFVALVVQNFVSQSIPSTFKRDGTSTELYRDCLGMSGSATNVLEVHLSEELNYSGP